MSQRRLKNDQKDMCIIYNYHQPAYGFDLPDIRLFLDLCGI